jgi:hypothetical protein
MTHAKPRRRCGESGISTTKYAKGAKKRYIPERVRRVDQPAPGPNGSQTHDLTHEYCNGHSLVFFRVISCVSWFILHGCVWLYGPASRDPGFCDTMRTIKQRASHVTVRIPCIGVREAELIS